MKASSLKITFNKSYLPRLFIYFNRQNSQYTDTSSTNSTSSLENDAIRGTKLKMSGWQAHGYGDISELQFSTKLKIPKIQNANECLVRVKTTSVNPIDVAMLGGYGSKLLNVMRCQSDIEFPLTFGREFCGELIQQGLGIGRSNNKNEVGDRVWGVVPVQQQGSHAEYVVVSKHCISRAPDSLSDEEAAAVLYAGLTAWSGLYITGNVGGVLGALQSHGYGNSALHKRILVLGGSGSVGSLGIQMLKAEGAQVLATCQEDAIDMVKTAGADIVIDYKDTKSIEDLKKYAPYDIVLDCAGQGAVYAKSLDFDYRQYITFSSPLLRNIEDSGLTIGFIKNILQLVESNASSLRSQKGLIKWGFFTPSAQGIDFLNNLVARKKLLPNIHYTYNFNDLPKAFEHVQNGHLRGKIIVTIP